MDVRLVAGTRGDLPSAVSRGAFLEGLYFRLNRSAIVLSPLRDRRADISALARFALYRNAYMEVGKEPPSVTPAALLALVDYDWPGNDRELRLVMERAALLARGDAILPEHLPDFRHQR